MIIWILIGFLIIGFIIRMLGRKTQGKVNGRIIKYVEENGKHYPIFSFVTKEGNVIEERNTTYQEELSVEDAYSPQEATNFLAKPLPVENITIVYNKKNPKDFIPQWID